jgi:hypothetical protein
MVADAQRNGYHPSQQVGLSQAAEAGGSSRYGLPLGPRGLPTIHQKHKRSSYGHQRHISDDETTSRRTRFVYIICTSCLALFAAVCQEPPSHACLSS